MKHTTKLPSHDVIKHMGLSTSPDGSPEVIICTEEGECGVALTCILEVHAFNEFLRSFGLGLVVVFENYDQYGKLIDECSKMLSRCI